jgi:hypothetical protein
VVEPMTRSAGKLWLDCRAVFWASDYRMGIGKRHTGPGTGEWDALLGTDSATRLARRTGLVAAILRWEEIRTG